MSKSLATVGAIVVGLALITLYSAAFTVSMTQQALVLQFGDLRRVVTEPGLNWKLPFIQNVIYLDKRNLYLNAPPEEIIAEDRKRLVVDAFARYRIVDALKFYQGVRDPRGADLRLTPLFASSLRNVLGENSLESVVRDRRAELMAQITESFNSAAQGLGVEIIDVRLRRVDLPEANSQAIYRRMQTEREREAAELRAQGQETAQRVRSRADRDVTVLIAEAERDAQVIRGEGDATRNQIFAEAFGADPEFFAFYRSMQAYEAGLPGDSTTMILSPESDFFRYFGDPEGRARR